MNRRLYNHHQSRICHPDFVALLLFVKSGCKGTTNNLYSQIFLHFFVFFLQNDKSGLLKSKQIDKSCQLEYVHNILIDITQQYFAAIRLGGFENAQENTQAG